MRLDSLLSWARSLTLQQRSPNWVLNLQMAVWQWWRLSECSSKTVSCLAYQMSRGLQDVARRVHRCCKLLNFLSHFVSLVEASWSILKHWLRFDWLCMGWLEQLHWLPSSCIHTGCALQGRCWLCRWWHGRRILWRIQVHFIHLRNRLDIRSWCAGTHRILGPARIKRQRWCSYVQQASSSGNQARTCSYVCDDRLHRTRILQISRRACKKHAGSWWIQHWSNMDHPWSSNIHTPLRAKYVEVRWSKIKWSQACHCKTWQATCPLLWVSSSLKFRMVSQLSPKFQPVS